MQLTIFGFGIAKDIIGGNTINIDLPETTSVAQLKDVLFEQYPDFKKLRSLAIAVNNEYAGDELLLRGQDDVVLIPPVSGG
ncbi:MoaD/ThiS family protein [Flavilitoribacter nigricans]|uniref:Molybdopterin synthase sulfur carrier subunit n=1 Tax=Flavilitoribacter nigricans (strain ATCC 23147 / DSM 23189 / NBRC 102662 / NCIMB 1420 / SS-2) TaxID=1122177 RepID=A0A2D0NI37_FLAN2|nr:MoaD/ThiS family protein [Flavilitoribacter nigricans]PHN08050.1 molybdopterin synthase sulfur carrier subunit [Flavilitoribacter nigricans DSM 23189 = NBRC 102662]